MKILLISGSRNPDGQTARAGNALLDGAAEAGAETEKIFLPSLKIERCRQCEDTGWGLCADEGRCVIEDDFASVFEKVKAADVVIFASPVYLWEISESLFEFCSRMRRICFHCGKYDTVNNKPAVGLAVAGGGGSGSIRTLFQLEQILLFSGFDVVDMYPVRRQNLEAKLPQLRIAGRWLATKPNSGGPYVLYPPQPLNPLD